MCMVSNNKSKHFKSLPYLWNTLPFLIGRFVIMIPLNKKIVLYILHFLYNQDCTQGGSRGFDRTPYFCTLKLILSLNIKYCMIMCAIVCRNLHSGIFCILKYHNFVSVWGPRILDCLLGQTRTPF